MSQAGCVINVLDCDFNLGRRGFQFAIADHEVETVSAMKIRVRDIAPLRTRAKQRAIERLIHNLEGQCRTLDIRACQGDDRLHILVCRDRHG